VHDPYDDNQAHAHEHDGIDERVHADRLHGVFIHLSEPDDHDQNGHDI
jgi:hypothetical protein